MTESDIHGGVLIALKNWPWIDECGEEQRSKNDFWNTQGYQDEEDAPMFLLQTTQQNPVMTA